MNSKLMLLIGFSLVVVGLIGGLAILNRTYHPKKKLAVNNKTVTKPVITQPIMTPFAFQGSVLDLIHRGGNFTCTWNSTLNNSKLSGTTYISGDKYSSISDVTSVINITVHAIGDGQKMYVWSEIPNMPIKGMVFPYSDLAATKPSGTANTTQIQQAKQMMKKINYNCKEWTPDSSKFIVPSNIKFQ